MNHHLRLAHNLTELGLTQNISQTLISPCPLCLCGSFYANGRVAWVEEIMVDADYRKMEIGRSLMQSFEGWATDRDAKLVALATRRAGKFYKALGYEESATYWRKLL